MKKNIVIFSFIISFLFLSYQSANAWSGVTRITWANGYSISPKICADIYDDLHLLFLDDKSGLYQLYYKRSTDEGSTWSTLNQVTWFPNELSSLNVTVVLNDIYAFFNSGNSIFLKKSMDGGITWSPPKQLTWGSLTRLGDVAIDSNGHIHLIYTRDGDLYHKTSTNSGIIWSPPHRFTWGGLITGNSSSPHRIAGYYASGGGPGLTCDTLNNLHVSWGEGPTVYYKKSTTGGISWSAKVRITWNDQMYPKCFHDIVTDSLDTIYLAWERTDIIGIGMSWYTRLEYRKSTDGGSTFSAIKILPGGEENSTALVLAVDSGDVLHGSFYCYESHTDYPITRQIFYIKSTDSGANWNNAQKLTWSSRNSIYPYISTDSNNTVHVVWQEEYSGSNIEIHYKNSK